MRTLVLALLVAIPAAAPGPAQAPAKPAPAKAPAYDVTAEVTLSGLVEDVHTSQARADHPGLHVLLKTGVEPETQTVEVHTCPVRFMKMLDFTIAKGDTLTVVGSRPGGVGIVLARELTKGQISLTVRDKTGSPVWR